jgi:hypothetical protein
MTDLFEAWPAPARDQPDPELERLIARNEVAKRAWGFTTEATSACSVCSVLRRITYSRRDQVPMRTPFCVSCGRRFEVVVADKAE